jgi:hypothetical protein
MTTLHNQVKRAKQATGQRPKLTGFHPKPVKGKGMKPYRKQPSRKEVLTFIEKKLPDIVAEEEMQ